MYAEQYVARLITLQVTRQGPYGAFDLAATWLCTNLLTCSNNWCQLIHIRFESADCLALDLLWFKAEHPQSMPSS